MVAASSPISALPHPCRPQGAELCYRYYLVFCQEDEILDSVHRPVLRLK